MMYVWRGYFLTTLIYDLHIIHIYSKNSCTAFDDNDLTFLVLNIDLAIRIPNEMNRKFTFFLNK